MKSRIIIDVDYDEVAKLPPPVANALFQLADRQEAARRAEVNPDQGKSFKVVSVDTSEDEAQRVASQMGPEGGRLDVDLTEGSPPWRPRHQQ